MSCVVDGWEGFVGWYWAEGTEGAHCGFLYISTRKPYRLKNSIEELPLPQLYPNYPKSKTIKAMAKPERKSEKKRG